MKVAYINVNASNQNEKMPNGEAGKIKELGRNTKCVNCYGFKDVTEEFM